MNILFVYWSADIAQALQFRYPKKKKKKIESKLSCTAYVIIINSKKYIFENIHLQAYKQFTNRNLLSKVGFLHFWPKDKYFYLYYMKLPINNLT